MREHPHPFYIAVDHDSIIVQAGPAPEAVRVPGYRIIGLDAVPSFTFGHPGAEIYGMKWSDEQQAIIKIRKPFMSMPAVKLRLWFLDKGLLPKVSIWIDSLQPDHRERVWIWWEYSGEFSRDYDYMPALVKGLEIDHDEFDRDWVALTGHKS